MKTEFKKVSEILALEDAEVLKEFEMVELQGGKELWVCENTSDFMCTIFNYSKCNSDCPCIGGGCQL